MGELCPQLNPDPAPCASQHLAPGTLRVTSRHSLPIGGVKVGCVMGLSWPEWTRKGKQEHSDPPGALAPGQPGSSLPMSCLTPLPHLCPLSHPISTVQACLRSLLPHPALTVLGIVVTEPGQFVFQGQEAAGKQCLER